MRLVEPYQVWPPRSWTTDPSLTRSAASNSARHRGSDPRTSVARRSATAPGGRQRAIPGPFLPAPSPGLMRRDRAARERARATNERTTSTAAEKMTNKEGDGLPSSPFFPCDAPSPLAMRRTGRLRPRSCVRKGYLGPPDDEHVRSHPSGRRAHARRSGRGHRRRLFGGWRLRMQLRQACGAAVAMTLLASTARGDGDGDGNNVKQAPAPEPTPLVVPDAKPTPTPTSAAKGTSPLVVHAGSEVGGYADSDHVFVLTPEIAGTVENPTAGWSLTGTYL